VICVDSSSRKTSGIIVLLAARNRHPGLEAEVARWLAVADKKRRAERIRKAKAKLEAEAKAAEAGGGGAHPGDRPAQRDQGGARRPACCADGMLRPLPRSSPRRPKVGKCGSRRGVNQPRDPGG
jgi:hypothetical protein